MHSDGALTVDELARFAAESGLDFIAVTDHNTISHHRELPQAARRYGVTLIPGQEVTTSEGHAGALGDVGWVDFRRPAPEWLKVTQDRGGLLSVNHPIAGPVSWMHAMPERPPLVEVWHWSWLDLSWTTPLSWWQAWDPVRHPGRRQRLAPDRIGRTAGNPDHVGGVQHRRPGRHPRQHRGRAGRDLRAPERPRAAAHRR